MFHHFGNVEALTQSDVIERTQKAMRALQAGPLAGYMPYTPRTEGALRDLAALKPKTLATMHGSSFTGDCERALHDLARVLKDSFGGP